MAFGETYRSRVPQAFAGEVRAPSMRAMDGSEVSQASAEEAERSLLCSIESEVQKTLMFDNWMHETVVAMRRGVSAGWSAKASTGSRLAPETGYVLGVRKYSAVL